MKKTLSCLLALVMLFSIAAVGSVPVFAEGTSSYTAGTYTGTAKGLSGDITVEVTFDENSITDIQVVESNETKHIMDTASVVIPQEIIENQSLAVDTVTGATFASNGIINAVADCAEQAGGDMDALYKELERETTDETVDVDVVVVGSGLAGMMTAATLKNSGVENVLLIEEQGMTGGSAVYSAGHMFGALDEDKLQYTYDLFMEHTTSFPATEENSIYPDPDKVEVLIQEGHNTFEYLESLGIELTNVDMDLDTPGDTRVIIVSEEAEEAGITSKGEALLWTLQNMYEDQGGEIRLETRATGLIQDEDGNVTGVTAETQTGTLTINAKYVVMCTGSAGGANGQEVMAKFMPTQADGEIRQLTIGSDGSGIAMMADIGADVYESWLAATAGCFSVNPISQVSNNNSNINIVNASEMFVDANGVRRAAEFNSGDGVYYFQEEGVEDSVYVVLTDEIAELIEKTDKLQEGLEQFPDRFFKGNTIEEAAEAAGLPADTVAATLAAYNGYCETGVDEEFGKAADKLVAMEEGPYYIVRYSITGKDIAGGVVTNTSGQVLDTEGNVIPGLYAAGFTSNRDYYGTSFVGSVGLQTCMTGGRIAAQSISAELAG